jgi:predicted Zn-dependent protease
LSQAVEAFLIEKKLGDRVENYEWEFKVLASDQINAWCMPGGKIGFYEGIMPVCRDDNGIAVVMAHEIAHAVALHSNERMSQQLMVNLGGAALSEAIKTEKETTQNLAMVAFGLGSQLGILLPYSRTHEEESDELGLYFMAMAGYDPQGAPVFWERMNQLGGPRPPEFLSTHPNPEERIKKINKNMNKAMQFYNKSKQR